MLSRDQIDNIINVLDDIARDYGDDYALPVYSTEGMQKMRIAIMEIIAETPQDINEIIEARKKQFVELAAKADKGEKKEICKSCNGTKKIAYWKLTGYTIYSWQKPDGYHVCNKC